jgi:hypothetical protein
MTTCRACSPRTPAPQDSASDPAGSSGSAVLILRVWAEDDQLRCRLLGASRSSADPGVVAVAQGVDAICAAVRDWLLDV